MSDRAGIIEAGFRHFFALSLADERASNDPAQVADPVAQPVAQVDQDAQDPQASQQAVAPATLPGTIFGRLPNKYTVPLLKRVLTALGINGQSRNRRQVLIDRLQVAETSSTMAQRRTIEFLLKHDFEVRTVPD
jgi:hypothetical protein